jgi:hypothetical protein
MFAQKFTDREMIDEIVPGSRFALEEACVSRLHSFFTERDFSTGMDIFD